MALGADIWNPAILNVCGLMKIEGLKTGVESLLETRKSICWPEVAMKMCLSTVERAIEAIARIFVNWRVAFCFIA